MESLNENNLYSFDDIKDVLYCQAIRIAKRYGLNKNLYQVDELVNESWIKGKFHRHKGKDMQLVSFIIYRDMLDYARGIERKKSTALKNAKDAELKRRNLDRISFTDRIEDEDELEYLLSCLDDKQKYIVTKSYGERFTLKEIAKELGYAESYVSTKRKMALNLIRANI
jgi:RNA polymerase sigma factor (sigma-70 family)